MLQQSTIPRTPEEVAMILSKLTENEQYMVKGIIIGLAERAQAAQECLPHLGRSDRAAYKKES